MIVGSVTSFIEAKYAQLTSSRWPPMVYEVLSLESLNECGLICYARPNKECQFFTFQGTDCFLGNWDTTEAATAVTDTATIYINYGKVFSRASKLAFK